MAEKRETRRFPRLKVVIKVQRENIDQEDSGPEDIEVSRNISKGGICLAMSEKLEPNERVLLEIALSEGGSLRLKARVAWVMENVKSQPWEAKQVSYGTGIEFLNISDEDREKIIKLALASQENKRGLK